MMVSLNGPKNTTPAEVAYKSLLSSTCTHQKVFETQKKKCFVSFVFESASYNAILKKDLAQNFMNYMLRHGKL